MTLNTLLMSKFTSGKVLILLSFLRPVTLFGSKFENYVNQQSRKSKRSFALCS